MATELSSLLVPLGVDAVVTTRHGGVSEGPYRSLNLGLHVGDRPERVEENRRRALDLIGADLDDLVLGEQAHGVGVGGVTRHHAGRGARRAADALGGLDGLVTTEPGLVLGCLVADCVPVLLVDPRAGVLACAHAGWRGTAGRIVDVALAAMERLGGRPERTTAYLGPAVGAQDYEVDRPVAEAIGRAFGPEAPFLEPDRSGHWRLDLHAANRAALVAAGVPAGQVHASRHTTADPDLFSHRGAGGGPCGRFALLARLRP